MLLLWMTFALSSSLVYPSPVEENESENNARDPAIDEILKRMKEMQREIRILNGTLMEASKCKVCCGTDTSACVVQTPTEEDEMDTIKQIFPHNLPHISRSNIYVRNFTDNTELAALKTETALIQPNVIQRQIGWEKTPDREMIVFWHYGGTIIFHMIYPDGTYCQTKLGNPLKDCDSKIMLNLPKQIWFKMEIDVQFGDKIVATLIKAPEFVEKREKTSKSDMRLRFPHLAYIIDNLPE